MGLVVVVVADTKLKFAGKLDIGIVTVTGIFWPALELYKELACLLAADTFKPPRDSPELRPRPRDPLPRPDSFP